MSSAPPDGYARRPLSRADVDALTGLSERHDEALEIEPEPARSFFDWILQLPFIRHERDTVVLERDGELVAFCLVARDPASEGAAMDWFGMVDPAHQGRGLGSWLLGWAHGVIEGRADEAPFAIRTQCPALDEAAHELFAGAGYRRVRTSWDMARALDGTLMAPPASEGIVVRRFEVGRDERTFWQVSEAAFAEHFGFAPVPYESWAADWYGTDEWDPSRVLFAEADGMVVGELAWVEADTDGYVANLGVLPEHRRRGVATTLLHAAFADMAVRGFARATLSVDADNETGAVGLYRGVGLEPTREAHVFERSPA